MKSKGNGTPQQCISNLLHLYQYEVHHARLKGMDPSIIDMPQEDAEITAKNHASWLVETYEPRVTVNDIKISYSESGTMIITPDVIVNEV